MPESDDPVTLDVSNLDVGQAALFLGWAATEAVVSRLASQGFDDVRPRHGLVIQRLVEDEGPSPSEIAEAIGVTAASVSRSLRELVAAGYVQLTTDPADRRRRSAHLTDRGRAIVSAARSARESFDHSLRRRLGAEAMSRLQETLSEALEAVGVADRVSGRRMRDPMT